MVFAGDRLEQFNQHMEDFKKCLIAAKQLEWVLDHFEEIPRVVDLTRVLFIVKESMKSLRAEIGRQLLEMASQLLETLLVRFNLNYVVKALDKDIKKRLEAVDSMSLLVYLTKAFLPPQNKVASLYKATMQSTFAKLGNLVNSRQISNYSKGEHDLNQ